MLESSLPTREQIAEHRASKIKDAEARALNNLTRTNWLLLQDTATFMSGLRLLIEEKQGELENINLLGSVDINHTALALQLKREELMTLKKTLHFASSGEYSLGQKTFKSAQ